MVFHVIATEGAKSCWCHTVSNPISASVSPLSWPPVTMTTEPTLGSRWLLSAACPAISVQGLAVYNCLLFQK